MRPTAVTRFLRRDHPAGWRAWVEFAAGGRMHGLGLARAVDWSSSRRVCDVGGGTGALLHVLLDRQPHLDGVLLDLPEVVARALPHPRMTVAGGDAFKAVPTGCDT